MNTDPVIRIEHVYKAPPARVWRALTEPEMLARWWVKGDVRPVVGHAFLLDMGKWGMQRCQVVEVEPERRLAYRFATETINTTITWLLAPEGTGTRLTLIQSGFDMDSPLSRSALEGMAPGWPKILAHMEKVLEEEPV